MTFQFSHELEPGTLVCVFSDIAPCVKIRTWYDFFVPPGQILRRESEDSQQAKVQEELVRDFPRARSPQDTEGLLSQHKSPFPLRFARLSASSQQHRSAQVEVKDEQTSFDFY